MKDEETHYLLQLLFKVNVGVPVHQGRMNVFPFGLVKCGRRPSSGAHTSCWTCSDIHSASICRGPTVYRHHPGLCQLINSEKGTSRVLSSQSLSAKEGPKDIIQRFQHFRVKIVEKTYFIHLHWALFLQEDLWQQTHIMKLLEYK